MSHASRHCHITQQVWGAVGFLLLRASCLICERVLTLCIIRKRWRPHTQLSQNTGVSMQMGNFTIWTHLHGWSFPHPHTTLAQASTSSLEAALLASLLHPSATQRCLTALALCSWLQHSTPPHPPTPTATTTPHSAAPDTQHSADNPTHPSQQVTTPPPTFPPALQDALQLHLAAASSSQPSLPDSPHPYSEVAPLHAQMHREVLALVSACLQCGLLLRMPGDTPVDQLLPVHVQALLSSMPAALQASSPPVSQASYGVVERAVQRLQSVLSGLMALELYLHGGAMACCAAAVVHGLQLPAKLNSVVQPLMAAVRRQPEEEMQVGAG